MKIEEFGEIRKKIQEKQAQESRLEGALDQIEEQLKKEPDIKDINQAEEVLNRLNDEIDKDYKNEDKMFEELEKITDWSKL
jgi:predicted RNase H-like nuclease (RuvC/YqgF family)